MTRMAVSRSRTWLVLSLGLIGSIGLLVFRAQVRTTIQYLIAMRPRPAGEKSVADRVREYSEVVQKRLEPDFHRASVSYPPASLAFLVFKQEKELQVYAPGNNGTYRFIRQYPILAASGHAGPKLKEGDYQVPEGLYRIESLNPNSNFHLSLRINYPNEFDRANAARDHRENLGGDIMIHGSAVSIGCLAMGDSVSEDLFVLAAKTGIINIQVLMCPQDFRVNPTVVLRPGAPDWLAGLYDRIKSELRKYPK